MADSQKHPSANTKTSKIWRVNCLLKLNIKSHLKLLQSTSQYKVYISVIEFLKMKFQISLTSLRQIIQHTKNDTKKYVMK